MDKPIPEDVRVLVAELDEYLRGCPDPDKTTPKWMVRRSSRLLWQCRDTILALTAAQQQQQGQAVACGGCGNADPEKVCIGCLHPFAAPPSAPVGVDEWECRCGLRGPHSAFSSHADCPLCPAQTALAQQPAAEFRNDGNSEADFIAHHADACTACGGSGQKADQQPAAAEGHDDAETAAGALLAGVGCARGRGGGISQRRPSVSRKSYHVTNPKG